MGGSDSDMMAPYGGEKNKRQGVPLPLRVTMCFLNVTVCSASTFKKREGKLRSAALFAACKNPVLPIIYQGCLQ